MRRKVAPSVVCAFAPPCPVLTAVNPRTGRERGAGEVGWRAVWRRSTPPFVLGIRSALCGIKAGGAAPRW